MKEAMLSSSAKYFKKIQPKWVNEGERIVSIQNRAQNVIPLLLSTANMNGVPFIIEELQPEKDSINLMLIKDQYRDIYHVIDDMVMLTASSHLRSSGRYGSAISDELITFGGDNNWQASLADKAFYYATEIQIAYNHYLAAFKNGYFKKSVHCAAVLS